MRFIWDPSDLNPEQAAAVTEPSSIFLIACPGSGKTRTLTYKIAYELSRRTDKRMVVAITYTHRAADEIQERIEDLGVDTSGLWIGTIHAFCLEWILKPYGIYSPEGTVAKLAMRQPFVLFKGLTFQKLCLPGAFRPGDHHNKMLRPGLCVVHASPQYL